MPLNALPLQAIVCINLSNNVENRMQKLESRKQFIIHILQEDSNSNVEDSDGNIVYDSVKVENKKLLEFSKQI